MTFRELLNSVRFEDVSPCITRMYPETEPTLGWFKIHFDMLRLMTPLYDKNANSDVCNITFEDDEDGTGTYLSAYPMEGDLWEHSLTKELVIAPEVQASNEEIAACCLWHTSFYGFVEEHIESFYRNHWNHWNIKEICMWSNRERFRDNSSVIRRHGGVVPTIRELSQSKKRELINRAKESILYEKQNKPKRKKVFRTEFLEHYYERMAAISDFIVRVIPALSNCGSMMTVKQLCGLFHSEAFCAEQIKSYADKNENGANYFANLLSKYDMLPMMDGIVVRIVTGVAHDIQTEDEQRLCNLLAKGRKYVYIFFDVDSSLGNQCIIDYATFTHKTNDYPKPQQDYNNHEKEEIGNIHRDGSPMEL